LFRFSIFSGTNIRTSTAHQEVVQKIEVWMMQLPGHIDLFIKGRIISIEEVFVGGGERILLLFDIKIVIFLLVDVR